MTFGIDMVLMTSRNFQQNNYGKGGLQILFILMPKMGLKLRLKA
jgi:hypothetical protein